MPRKRSRLARTAPYPVRTLSGAFGTVPVNEFAWWAAWLDGRDPAACLSRPPDGTGWVKQPLIGESLVGMLVGAVFQVDSDPAVRAAREWLRECGMPYASRDDALAVNAYHRTRPTYPGVMASFPSAQPRGGATQPPWWVTELGCPWPPTRQEIVSAYRLRTQATHPDKPGGNAAAFERTKRAYERGIGWVAEQEEAGR